jgi:hypothetical protein
MNAFQAIPGMPGYEVNGLGQVRGRSGKILKHDSDGRVQINTPRGPRRFYIGELVPVYKTGADSPEKVDAQDEQEALQRRVDHLERVIMEYEATHGSFDPFGGEA